MRAKGWWNRVRRSVVRWQEQQKRRRRDVLRSALRAEMLERRELLATGTISFSATSGKVTIQGTGADDVGAVSVEGSQLRASITTGADTLSRTYDRAVVTQVVFYAKDGNDAFSNASDVTTSVYGGGGNDTLDGGSGLDRLYGEAGDDTLRGNGGADQLAGGGGNDTLEGGAGDDRLLGEDGNDVLNGHDGVDDLRGGGGNDTLSGGRGNDRLSGDLGDDSVSGGDGDDYLVGGDGIDTLDGGAGLDLLYGSAGNDTLEGGDGDDQLYGGNDQDTLRGGGGNDKLRGELGDDRLEGGVGADDLSGSDGNDVLLGGEEADVLIGGGGNDTLDGGAGNDRLEGYDGDDILNGGDGADALRGGGGNDTLSGGNDADELRGDAGDDTASGDGGDDVVRGGDGNDVLHGGAGNDRLFGENGDDALTGDAGDDAPHGGAGRDLVIGGDGIDEVVGGDSDGADILIGGPTDWDANDAALRGILATWSDTTLAYDARTAAIEAAGFAFRLQSLVTVHDDFQVDTLLGKGGQDWFFLPGGTDAGHDGHGHSHDADYLDTLDLLPDIASNEKVNSNVPHANNPTLRREHFALFALVDRNAATHTVVGSGAWSSPATWQNGVLPTDGANVLVPAGMSVTVDGVIAARLHTLRLDGTLEFAPNANTELRVDTLIADTTAVFRMGTAAAPIADGVSARLVIADSGAIDRVWDPFELSRGFISHGTATIHGAAKTSQATLAAAPRAGDTQLTLSAAPAGWKVGDRLVIAGVERGRHEERTIVALDGATVTVAALAFDHVPPSADLSVHVANLTRNAVIVSENADPDRRGHVMFMHSQKVNIDFAQFESVGRTDKKVAANDSVVDDHGQLVAGTGTNQRGRYAVHFHRTGTNAATTPARVNGSAVIDSLGWGYVNHSSHVRFTQNVAFDVDGAAFVTEAGDEIGAFDGNLAIHSVGSGQGVDERSEIQDFGHQGDGFWFQGGGPVVTNNVASGQAGNGFIFFTRGLEQEGLGRTAFVAANLADPTLAGGRETIDVGEVPILGFRDNTAYASRIGAATRFHQLRHTHTTASRLEDLTLWNNVGGLSIPYTNQTVVSDVRIERPTARTSGTGVSRNSVTRNITYENLRVVGYRDGLLLPLRGTNVVRGGYFNNLSNLVIATAVGENRSVTIEGPIAFGTLPPTATTNTRQQNIVMRADFASHDESVRHVFFPDTVTLNFDTFANRRLYFREQAASFVPFPAASAFVPAEYVGKTNAQLRTEFGIAVGGAIAPADAVEVPGIVGLLAP